MRRDLIIGIFLSALLHVGVFWGDKLIKFKPPAPQKEEEKPKIMIFDMPKLEPEEPEKVDTTEEAPQKVDIAPPMLTDVPQIATDTSFVQKLQPPPPDATKPSVAVTVIPQNLGNQFKGMQVFDPSMLDQQPVPQYQARPNYPFEMRRAGISGEVTVDFIVDPDGNVANAFALKSSQKEFEPAAVHAVSKWKFKAGRKAGKSVPTHMQVPIVFTLSDEL
jgi:periplasmic protein TonB